MQFTLEFQGNFWSKPHEDNMLTHYFSCGINQKTKVPVWFKREDGEKPSWSRRCNRGRNPLNATALLKHSGKAWKVE